MLWQSLYMNVRRRRFRQKTIKSPSLATIPEGSTLTLDSNSKPNENGLASSHCHPNRIIKARNNRRDDRLRIWFLILLPAYIITTSLMILRPFWSIGCLDNFISIFNYYSDFWMSNDFNWRSCSSVNSIV